MEDKSAGDNSTNSPDIPPSGISDPFHGLSFQVGVAENKNLAYRSKMEDVHTYVANFAEKPDWGYFAIFDGHAGKQSARWCGNNLHALLEQELLAKEDSTTNGSSGCDVQDVFRDVFAKADELIEQEGSGSSGCTAAVAVLRWEGQNGESGIDSAQNLESNTTESLHGKHFDYIPRAQDRRMLYTLNVGDSRIVLCRGDKTYRLSYDHKASDGNEIERIRSEGGLVIKNRVNGFLAITRSLGNSYVKNLVTGKPFTTATALCKEDEFLILACDGLWDVISDDAACRFVQGIFQQQRENNKKHDPAHAAKKLCQLALDKNTMDNITVMVVLLDGGVFGHSDTI